MSADTLYYVHDPMCSWCWGFRPCWQALCRQLDDRLCVRYVLGGLAPDSDQIMPLAMQSKLQQTWQQIQQVIPGTEFNFDFWQVCQPRRSTYPACRAVLAAGALVDDLDSAHIERQMILAIQQAYYLHAKNPSDNTVLTDLAVGLGLARTDYARKLESDEIQQQLMAQIDLARELTQHGFPSLVLQVGADRRQIQLDYNRPEIMLAQII